MLKRTVRSLISNRSLLYRFVLILGLGVLLLIQFSALAAQELKYWKVKNEASLVERIPEMETSLVLANINLDLGGTLIKNGMPYALINKNIYEVGSIFEKYYTIIQIDRGTVVLENRLTKERKTLSLPVLSDKP